MAEYSTAAGGGVCPESTRVLHSVPPPSRALLYPADGPISRPPHTRTPQCTPFFNTKPFRLFPFLPPVPLRYPSLIFSWFVFAVQPKRSFSGLLRVYFFFFFFFFFAFICSSVLPPTDYLTFFWGVFFASASAKAHRSLVIDISMYIRLKKKV